MSHWKQLAEYQTDLERCVRCGACQAFCPVYQETGHDAAATRGKVVLAASLLSGDVDVKEKGLQHALGLCLLCGSCRLRCPNQVPGDAIIAAVRQQISEKEGLSSLGRQIGRVLGSPSLLSNLSRGAGLFSGLLFRKIPKSSGLRLRFPLQSLRGRSLPPVPCYNIFDRVPEFLAGHANKPLIALFAGCAISYLYPQTGEALARLLHRLGYSVWLPRTQGCCGMPALSSGNGELLSKLAATNMEAFCSGNGKYSGRKVDYLLTACASCGHMLAGHYAELAELSFPMPIMDIHVFLEKEGLVRKLQTLPRKTDRFLVCYHDPCHLRNQGITAAPRQLLRALPQTEYVEMNDAALCCGLGGTFAATCAEHSRKIGDRKIDGLRASGANTVATACPGCMLQLQDIVIRANLPLKVVHSVDLIAEAVLESSSSRPLSET